MWTEFYLFQQSVHPLGARCLTVNLGYSGSTQCLAKGQTGRAVGHLMQHQAS